MPHLVGVTGTNGKTSTTRWIAAALARSPVYAGPIARLDSIAWSVGTDDLGARRDAAALDAALRALAAAGGAAAAIELTSHALSTGFGRALDFRVAVFTNLSQEHLEIHDTFERYLACKAQLFVRLGAGATAILNARDDASRILCGVLAPGVEVRTYAVASRGPAWRVPDVEATEIGVTPEGTTARLSWAAPEADAPEHLHLRAIGEVFVENALAALLAARASGVSFADATAAIVACAPPPGRFAQVASSPDVFIDVAHSPDALARTLATARALAVVRGGRVLLVFGSGGQRDVPKRSAMGKAAAGADWSVVTSDEAQGGRPIDVARAIVSAMCTNADVRIELDRARAIGLALAEAEPRDVVVVAGRGPIGAPRLGTTTLASDEVLIANARITAGPGGRRPS